jgi:hypothetical protein
VFGNKNANFEKDVKCKLERCQLFFIKNILFVVYRKRKSKKRLKNEIKRGREREKKVRDCDLALVGIRFLIKTSTEASNSQNKKIVSKPT